MSKYVETEKLKKYISEVANRYKSLAEKYELEEGFLGAIEGINNAIDEINGEDVIPIELVVDHLTGYATPPMPEIIFYSDEGQLIRTQRRYWEKAIRSWK